MADTKLSASEVFDVADAMMAAAYEAFLKRRDTPDLKKKDRQALMDQEVALRYDSDRYRAVGISLLANDAELTAKSLKDSIDHATATLKRISDIKKAILVLTALIEFGVAIASGNVKTIVASAKKLKKTAEENAKA